MDIKIFKSFKFIFNTTNRACPYCGGKRLERKKRWVWMRLINGSKYYRCRTCQRKSLLVGVTTKRRSRKRSS